MSDLQKKQEFWKTQQAELQDKLSKFEERAETPFVPGELDDWLESTRDALDQLLPLLQLYTQHIHAEELDEIAEEDPELINRVEMMREEDQFLSTRLDQIRSQLESIQQRHEVQQRGDENERGSETELKQDLDQFVSDALELVMRIRKQEVTIRTWLVEAFTRDRGVID